MTLNNLSALDDADGRIEESLATSRRVLAIWEKHYDPAHPNLGIVHNNIGEKLRRLGRFDEAFVHYDRALAILEKALDADHPAVSMVRSNQGLLHFARADLTRAAATLTRALEGCDRKACDPSVVGEASFALARCVWPRDPARARGLAARAREAYAKRPGPALDEVTAWLADKTP